jgi:hypothetical protein
MSSNKTARQKLEKEYGKGCMFKKANIEEKIENKKTIKTYKKFLEERHYTGKFIKLYKKQMNYHHLKHKSEGGETTIENGAIVSALAHMYMHSLPREQEEFINDELRKYKQEIDECKVVLVDDLDVPYKVNAMEFSIKEKYKEIEEEER